MKIYRPLAEGIVQNLLLVFNGNQQADRVVSESLKSNKKWGSRDRNFVAENTYDIIRWWRLLKYSAEINERKITDESLFWKMLGTWFLINDYSLPEWEEFEGLDAVKVKNKQKEALEIRKVRESIPDWLDEIGENEVPNWEAEIGALNQKAELFIRVNSLKVEVEALQDMLLAEGLETETVEGLPWALKVVKRAKLDHLKAYRKGFFEVQDAGSQSIAEFLMATPGMEVVDACAGAGGKALALAGFMENEGQILALDIHVKKLDELKKRALRNGVGILEVEKIGQQTVHKYQSRFDRVLLDVPCSGLGVLKRKPDTKWKLKPQFLENIKATQAQILQDYSRMLKPNGKLVYATCSVLQSENQDQIEHFLAENPDFILEEERFLSPSETGFDGFYMARLSRA
ncbi:RsmB/NOP family class I SAM-dependent RNA methyltransferase [Marinilongibacter aquaticus]|uniref:RsmB/NOP family class I SAM-dependent RNA methyltransferase n=1 Tax=Marinilongibacter aquaticus TaxID=2975157 RepID=UPI0021BDB86C|nr:RsmB/NOP family class I SAM-dependent RNA methyltransferase [Marinilongibacter aquaticus]UBM59016.1 RsmB/NOP family class I SAM-dependent RNA methyltransferase [Marinilongibacter aquaticus]